ncbi:sulfurtransferase [Sorangium cellulosum]|uniref:Sulfurtransferase n=1 Tax=Sorangium cellulosum TaxID=56 RepID=A0A2L0EQI7_SORCE|nr:rhodanese-like domain-containing protein [Sorangium cellulosum]AUX41535.1 sulfurtransferase [Sorangium cellulosum]
MSNEIGIEELSERIGRGDGLVVAEVLPAPYYEAGHLPGAVNLPLDGLEKTIARVAPGRDTPIVVYCSGPTCRNSHTAAARLAALGYGAVRVFAGGKAAWRDAGLAMERAAAAAEVQR